MNVCYLILAHGQPRHLARLIRHLQDGTAYFFVHVDRKWDPAPFERALAGEPDVLLLPEREKVFWGGFSQVRAVLRLLAAARQTEVPFAYYCLLSDSDFPIKSKEQIKAALRSGREFISIDRFIEADNLRLYRNLSKYHFYDSSLLNPRAGVTLHGRLLRRALVHLNNDINEWLPDRVLPARLRPCHGSAWWCLSGPCLEHLLQFIDRNNEYFRFFRFTRSSDEIFFHTILNASPFAGQILHHVAQGTARGNEYGSHYIDWSGGDASPKVLDEEDLDALLTSACLFARKFSETRSSRLIARLERHIA